MNYEKRNYDEHIAKLENMVGNLTVKVNEIDKKLFIGNGKPSVMTSLELQNMELCYLKNEFINHCNNDKETKDAIVKPFLSSGIGAIIGAIISIISLKIKS